MITTEDLENMFYLPGELKQIDRQIDRQTEKLERLSSIHPTPKKDCAAAVAELISIYKERRRLCAAQLEKLRMFISGIEDPGTRELFILRYERGKTWVQIHHICTGKGQYYADGSSIRKICERYIKRYNRNEAKQSKKGATEGLL